MRDFATMWDGVVDSVKAQIAASGEGVCHSGIMQQVLQERIVGPESEEKYAVALEVFAKETKSKVRIEKTAGGAVFYFLPDLSAS